MSEQYADQFYPKKNSQKSPEAGVLLLWLLCAWHGAIAIGGSPEQFCKSHGMKIPLGYSISTKRVNH